MRNDQSTSWILKAIEGEAFNRAVAFVQRTASPTMFGLNAKQILVLMEFYEKGTGTLASSIPDDGVLK